MPSRIWMACAWLVACAGCSSDTICPTLQPTFTSIKTQLLQTSSCGSMNASSCHSAKGAQFSGNLDYATDPYVALLGTDGKGAPAQNIKGSAMNLLRVKPGDPANSFIVIKLKTKSGMDPQYGSGMPFPAPGSVCSTAVDTISQWIAAGAKND
jgi:hypothetical protein